MHLVPNLHLGAVEQVTVRNRLRSPLATLRALPAILRLNQDLFSCIVIFVSQSLANILVHTVFSTKDRRPFLREPRLREELHRYLGGILTNLSCPPLVIGGVEDHVHLLSAFSRTCEPATMVKELKRGSSLWLKTKSPGLTDFAWQSGYGIFSIGCSQVETMRKYIAGQEEHHRKIGFQDEYRELLKRHAIPFDERYVWD